MKIGIYYRVSTDYQTTERQTHLITNWIKEKGYSEAELVEYVEDMAISGAKENRNGFQALKSDIKAGNLSKVIIAEFSRLSRDFMGFLRFMELCDSHGVEVEVPNKPTRSFNSAKDKLLASIEAFMAEQERETHSERIRQGIAKVISNGEPWGLRKGHKVNLGRRADYRKKYSPELIEKILLLSNEGLSTHKIAKVVGVNQTLIVRILRREKIDSNAA